MQWSAEIFGFTRKSEDLIENPNILDLGFKVPVMLRFTNRGLAQIKSAIKRPGLSVPKCPATAAVISCSLSGANRCWMSFDSPRITHTASFSALHLSIQSAGAVIQYLYIAQVG